MKAVIKYTKEELQNLPGIISISDFHPCSLIKCKVCPLYICEDTCSDALENVILNNGLKIEFDDTIIEFIKP